MVIVHVVDVVELRVVLLETLLEELVAVKVVSVLLTLVVVITVTVELDVVALVAVLADSADRHFLPETLGLDVAVPVLVFVVLSAWPSHGRVGSCLVVMVVV